ncbi:DUF418 domain-containing protein [Myceligenerans cantabricum]
MSTTLTRGPVRSAERSPAPDLARGAMLLLIAVANTPFYLLGREHARGNVHPVGGSWLDRVVDFLTIVAVDQRVYPMFAFLFGYGMMQLYSRQIAAGTSPKRARRLVQVRNLWLLVAGFLHAALLWQGDILGAYGLAGLLLVRIFLGRREGTLLMAVSILLGLLLSVTGYVAADTFVLAPPSPAEAAQAAEPFPHDEPAIALTSYLASVPARLGAWAPLAVAQGTFGLVVPMMILLGLVAGRRRILESPGEHLPLLRRVAVFGVATGFLGGLPSALDHAGVLRVPAGDEFFALLPMTTGFFGGLGYVAVFGLVGCAVARRRRSGVGPAEVQRTSVLVVDGVVAGAVQAVGRRSLTCYLLQSVLCAPVLAGWGLGLGQHLTSFSMFGYAVVVWLLTVVFAVWQEQRGMRGPAEVLLRRLVYRRVPTADGPPDPRRPGAGYLG